MLDGRMARPEPDDDLLDDLRNALEVSRTTLLAAHDYARQAIERTLQMRPAVERRQSAEKALRASEEAALAHQRALAVAAHELRQSLAALSAAWSVYRMGPPEDRRAARAEDVIDRQLAVARRLVSDLFDASDLTFNTVRLQRRRVTIQEVLSDALEAIRPKVVEAGHTVHLDLPSEPVWIDADVERLQQVFSNLLGNAVKYTPNNGHLSIFATAQNELVTVAITDDGEGIAGWLLPTIFEPFRRGTEAGHGLGLGLAIAQGVARLHDGDIIAQSDGPGHGSVFTVTLPTLKAQTET